MTLAQWQAAGLDFDYRGHRIFYRREGRGTPLLLIHGFPTASWDWYRIWDALTARFDVIAPDMIGFGFSAKPPDYPYSLLDQATLIESLLAELGVERYHLVAHDYGDSVAQELLARQVVDQIDDRVDGDAAARIETCCLLNGGIIPGSHRPLLVQKLLMSPVGFLIGRLVNKGTLRRSFDDIFGADTRPTEQELDDFWALIEYNGGRRVFHRLIRYMRERKEQEARWVGVLRRPGVPLRLVNGPEDPISGGHVVTAFRELVPRADVVELAGIGHYPQVEAPQRVSAAILEQIDAAAVR
ncbi:alpha/beta hydrolase [Acidobacteria bacterium Mor1]|nr:alpha/beta hydrolase [Acidobacteria bacterium Mor1]